MTVGDSSSSRFIVIINPFSIRTSCGSQSCWLMNRRIYKLYIYINYIHIYIYIFLYIYIYVIAFTNFTTIITIVIIIIILLLNSNKYIIIFTIFVNIITNVVIVIIWCLTVTWWSFSQKKIYNNQKLSIISVDKLNHRGLTGCLKCIWILRNCL